jgi:hypothetical protein
MPFCTKCGHDNPADARFCSQCGTALGRAAESAAEQTSTISSMRPTAEPDEREAVASPEENAAVAALRPGSALLVVRTGPDAGSRYLLDAELVAAGRHGNSDIFLDDVTVSRRHAEFVRGASGYLLRDVGSLNGTYVNKDRIDEVELRDGDEVQIGKYRLVYLISSEEPAAAEGSAQQ